MASALNQFNSAVQNIPGYGIATSIYQDKIGDYVGDKDPFFEVVPGTDKRRRKQPPPGISEEQRRLWKKIMKRAWYHDRNFCNCFSIDLGIGMIGIVAILPFIGSYYIYKMHAKMLWAANRAGCPAKLQAAMAANVATDTMRAIVPLLGTILCWMGGCSSRNAGIFDNWLRKEAEKYQQALQYKQQYGDQLPGQAPNGPPSGAPVGQPPRGQSPNGHSVNGQSLNRQQMSRSPPNGQNPPSQSRQAGVAPMQGTPPTMKPPGRSQGQSRAQQQVQPQARNNAQIPHELPPQYAEPTPPQPAARANQYSRPPQQMRSVPRAKGQPTQRYVPQQPPVNTYTQKSPPGSYSRGQQPPTAYSPPPQQTQRSFQPYQRQQQPSSVQPSVPPSPPVKNRQYSQNAAAQAYQRAPNVDRRRAQGLPYPVEPAPVYQKPLPYPEGPSGVNGMPHPTPPTSPPPTHGRVPRKPVNGL